MIREYIRNQEQAYEKLEQMKLWQRAATIKVAQDDWIRVSDPVKPL